MLSLLPRREFARLTSAYGYWLIALVVGLASMGLPLPGARRRSVAAGAALARATRAA